MTADPFAVDVPFIGRADELALVRRLATEAVGGQPRLLLLSGDAGMGKSRLVAETVRTARSMGFEVLAGACHEDVAIPYLPIVTALRRVDHPGARAFAPSPDARSAGRDVDGEDRRLQRSLDATAALVDTAARGPTMLVVEDVHWADEASADLLRHLLLSSLHEAEAAALPLFVVLTTRAPWPDGVPAHLARLPREDAAVELHLGRMNVVEAHAMTTAMAGARPRTEATTAVLEASAGNPLLMRGVISRSLATEHLVVRDGEVVLANRRPLEAPTDLDDELRISLGRVEPEVTDLLRLAAVLGDGAELAALEAAAGPDIADRLDAAAGVGLLQVGAVRFRFAHPQLRQVLYHDLPPAARAEAHLQVGAALERVAEQGNADDWALAVTHHLRRGGADPSDERVARWALKAGDQAWSSGAWAAATEAYGVALGGGAQALLEPGDLTEVLLRTGIAAYYASDDAAPGWLAQAAELARAHGDVARRAEALLLAARFQLIGTAASLGAPVAVTDLEALVPQLEDQPSLRARTLATLADLAFVELADEQAAAYAAAAEAALEGADRVAAAHVSFVLGLQAMSSIDLDSARRHFERVIATADEHDALAGQTRLGMVDLAAGRVRDAVATLTSARRGERAISSHAGQQLPSAALAGLHVLQGDHADAERLADEVIALYRIQPYAFTPGLVLPTLAAARVARGDVAGARDAIDQWRDEGGRGTWRYDALVRAFAGDTAEVARELAVRAWPAVRGTTLFTADVPSLHVAVGCLVGDTALLAGALGELERLHGCGLVLTLGWPWLVSRLVADGHLALGEAAAAERWYRTAEEEARRGALEVERAQVTLGRARLALAQGRTAEAAALAATSARALDAVDALLPARAARAVIEQAGGGEAPEPRDRVILFTDIVGSTALNVRAGDDQYVPLLAEHDRILRARFRRHDGVEHAHTGDGMSAWFTSALTALDCAFGMLSDLERAAMAHPELPIRIRVGISAGRPIDTGTGIFGLAVVTSARICALAGADQVYVSDEVRAAAEGTWTFRPVGDVDLKGLPHPEPIHEALPLPAR